MENDECNEPKVTAVVDKAARGGETVFKHLKHSVNTKENGVFYCIS